MTNIEVSSLWAHKNSRSYESKVICVTERNVFLEAKNGTPDFNNIGAFLEYWAPLPPPPKKYKVWVYENDEGTEFYRGFAIDNHNYTLKAILTGKEGDGL